VEPAILVQQLIEADASVVLFSAHPVTGNPDEVLINASWGLGESVVGGTVTPDAYTVRKADLAVTARHIARKERMTVAVSGGTREVGVPRVLQSRPTLDDRQVDELARLGIALERRMGWPVDAECAYKGARLRLLQCRPITTV
jgi:pyruvate,water dikinase